MNFFFFVFMPLFVVGQVVLGCLLLKGFGLKQRQERAEKDAEIARQEAMLRAVQGRG